MNFTAEDFRNAAISKNISRWHIHDCSLCDYPCAFIFFRYIDEKGHPCEVVYDSGCNCVSYTNISQRTWQDVADHYHMQTNPNVIKEMNEFWGFSNEKR